MDQARPQFPRTPLSEPLPYMSDSYNTGLRRFFILRSRVDTELSEERKAHVQKDHCKHHRQQRQ